MYQLDNIKNLPDLEHLRSFVVFYESKNITEAAIKLKISQPLLTQHLQRLEETVAVQLFTFQGRKKVLTAAGAQLYDVVSVKLRNLGSEIRSTLISATENKKLKIGGRKEVLNSIVETIDFNGHLTFIPMSSQEVNAGLINRTIDIGLTQKDLSSSHLVRKKIWSDEPLICWNKSIRVSDKQDMTSILKQLVTYPCLDYGAGTYLEKAFIHAQIKLNTKQLTTFPDWKILAQRMEMRASWGILPSRFVAETSKLNSIKLPYPLNQKTQFYIYYSKEWAQVDWFQELVNQISAN